MAEPRYEYHINAEDVIIQVNGDWRSFAQNNTAPELPDRAVGSWLWQHIKGKEVKHLYRALMDRVREEEVEARVPFRCDAPELRRFMSLELSPLPDRGIRFVSWSEKEEPRPLVPLLHTPPPHGSPGTLRMCAWCKRVATSDGEWLEVEEAMARHRLFDDPRGPTISHGVCTDCKADVMAEVSGRPHGSGLKTRRRWGR